MGIALRRAAAGSALLASLALRAALAQPVTPAPLTGGEVTFLIHSTIVGGIEGRAPIAHAEFRGDRLEAVQGAADVRVADMRTGNGTRDRHLRRTMDADSFPTIHFDLRAVEPGLSTADSMLVTLEGRLTLHGVTREVRAKGSVVPGPRGLRVEAAFPLDMRDFGIKPPVRALILRVAPDVLVSVHLLFGSAGSP